MLTMKDGFHPDSAPQPMADGSLSISSIIGVLKRQWPVVAASALAFGILAVVYLLTATPYFTASSSIIIDTRQNQLLQQQKLMSDIAVDTSAVDSQVEVVGSERLALEVIRKLGLDKDPEFVGPDNGLMSKVRGAIGAVKGLFGGGGGPEISQERKALEVFDRRLRVKRVGLTYVLTIDFTSVSPTKAATIANSVALTYIQSDLRSKYEATKRAGDWLQSRLAELRIQATAADQAVQTFRTKNSLIDTSRGAMNEQQLAELNSQLITAKSDTAQAKARLDRIAAIRAGDVPDATVSDALASPVVSRLRAQFLDLSNRAAEISARYGAKHTVTLNLQAQMEQIRGSIAQELQRLNSAYLSDYEIAQARETSLQTSLDQLVSKAGVNSDAQVQLRDLESTAETNRALYESFLQMARQTTQQETFPVSDTRILADASTPLQKSSPPSFPIVLLGAFMVGAALGGIGAFAREALGDVFRTVADVERETAAPCLGILPVIPDTKFSRRRSSFRGLRRNLSPRVLTFALDAPFSRFTETLRHIKVSLDLVHRRESRVVGIVSAVPREGKSVLASNLAHLIASTGQKVLLIDGDLHARSLSTALAPDAREGLVEALKQPSRLHQLVRRQELVKLDFLPCHLDSRTTKAAEILSSAEMAELLARVRTEYDYIFIDLPPIVPVVDAKAAAHLIDHFVLAIDWSTTTKTVVVEALSSSEGIRSRLLGSVINRADPTALKRIEYYKGAAFQDYYIESGMERRPASAQVG